MKLITAYKEGGEYWFTPWHEVNKENADEVFQTEVTDGDFERMMDEHNDDYKDKVKKLLEQHPFTNK